jgi:RNA polymerase sigma factor (sigma-70 family)
LRLTPIDDALAGRLADPQAREVIDRVLDAAIVADALGRLPSRQRASVYLRYMMGFDDAAIAAILGCTQSTVRSHVARGVNAMKLELSEHRPKEGGQHE